MRLSTWLAAAGSTAAALAIAFACTSSTDNNCGSGTPPSLVGSYSLQSYTIGISTLTPPQASGTLRFYPSAYSVSLTVAGQPVADTGSYVITGSRCISQSSLNGNPQFVGTFSLSGTTLTVTGTAAGQAVASQWTKTS
jgi:hypothetical protein